MTTTDKKPFIIVAVVAVIAVLVMAGGLVGNNTTAGDGGWRDRLAGLHGSAALSPQDLTVTAGSCQITGNDIVVADECTLTVAGAGLLAFGSATRRATLAIPIAPAPAAVAVRTVVENVTVTRTMQPGDTVDVVFGRSGGTLQVSCQDAPSCRVTLSSPASGG